MTGRWPAGTQKTCQDAFTIAWDNQHVTCPNGVVSTQGAQRTSEEGLATIRVRFSPADCGACPQLRECVNSAKPRRRETNLRPRDEYEALQQARKLQATDGWKDRYKIRAGVEGTISQAVNACGLRRTRYRGLAKTSLQHQLTGAAVNLIRINAWLTGTPRARTRTSPLTALRPAA
ncbi:hypothetical protein EES43_22410 [Streptomyces sp. ADI96-02]|nr:hypothetical protein EES43_22410 [Streptomyces sp. ADI96-02]